MIPTGKFWLTTLMFFLLCPFSFGEEALVNSVKEPSADIQPPAKEPFAPIFDDKTLLDGYAKRYQGLSKDILLEMMKDDTLSSYQMASAIKVFCENYSNEVVSHEKHLIEKILLRRLNRTDSPFVQVEVMYTLCVLDRYRYFSSMVPPLIQKLDHYNSTVNDFAFERLNNLVAGSNRGLEARVVFNTLRKILFLSRNRLMNVKEPGPKLTQKLKLLRWSIKVLGSQELKKLPKEVISLL